MKKSFSIFAGALFTVCFMITLVIVLPKNANAGLATSSSYVNSTLANRAFIEEAVKTLQAAKFGETAHSSASVSGTRGAYTALIRAIPEKKMVFIVVIGPNSDDCSKLMNFIKTNGIW